MRQHILIAGVITVLSLAAWAADPVFNGLRGGTPINEQTNPPPLYNAENKDVKRPRAYAMQPPTIPHKIDNYQLDINANKCLSCHSRSQAPETQAPMVSVTHYQDRDGNFLADVSPRRYFCLQCHVVQAETKPAVESTFEDIDDILKRKSDAAKAGKK